MEEKKYHIEESKIAGDKVCETSPAYASVASESVSYHVIDSGIEQEDEIPVLKIILVMRVFWIVSIIVKPLRMILLMGIC